MAYSVLVVLVVVLFVAWWKRGETIAALQAQVAELEYDQEPDAPDEAATLAELAHLHHRMNQIDAIRRARSESLPPPS